MTFRAKRGILITNYQDNIFLSNQNHVQYAYLIGGNRNVKPDDILKIYIPLVKFIGNIFGENAEVVLHDIRHLEKSIIALSDHTLTGRKIGGTITDFALGLIHDKEYERRDSITNYTGKMKGDNRTFRSSTYFIKDDEGNLIGMFCINVDITPYLRVRQQLDSMLMFDSNADTLNADQKKEEESFASSFEEVLGQMVCTALGDYAVDAAHMTIEEKKQVVATLQGKGAFLLKGAVGEVAQALDVSEQTIYRYLKEI